MLDTRGRGTGSDVLTGEGTGREMRKSCSILEEMNPVTGEPIAVKAAHTARGGMVEKGLSPDTTWGTECIGKSEHKRYLVSHLLYYSIRKSLKFLCQLTSMIFKSHKKQWSLSIACAII
jgi:hypothetical protein